MTLITFLQMPLLLKAFLLMPMVQAFVLMTGQQKEFDKGLNKNIYSVNICYDVILTFFLIASFLLILGFNNICSHSIC